MGQEFVILLLRRDAAYDRGVLRGAIGQSRQNPEWQLSVRQFVTAQTSVEALSRERALGVIGRMTSADLLAAARMAAKWVVNISHIVDLPNVPRVGVDDRAVGRLAAEHLLERGIEHFAFVGIGSAALSRDRQEGFVARLAEVRRHAAIGSGLTWGPYGSDLSEDERALCRWLIELPKPAGVFVPIDTAGERLLQLSQAAGCRVPEQIAVVGVDNDDLICELSVPPLSSVVVPGEEIGREAVRLLGDLIDGRVTGPVTRLLPPTLVVARRSSDLKVSRVPEVTDALSFIYANRHRPISVAQVQDAAAVSRRQLELLFRQHLGRTPLQEIHRVHVELARQLLAETELPLEQIARATGLVSREQFSRIFAKFTGQPPAAFRRMHRQRRGSADV